MTRTMSAVSLVLALALTMAVAEEPKATLTTADSAELPLATRITPVSVTNFPVTQAVEGTVNVGNLPATQEVTGQVSVANLPLDSSGNLRVSTPGPRTFRFVGVTTQTFQANAGRAAMMAGCAAEYPGARMAFADEYSSTANPPPVPQTAWIQPRALLFGNIDGSTPRAYDAAGNAFSISSGPYAPGAAGTFDCGSWSTNSGYSVGGAISPGAWIGSTSCDGTFAVACAAPE